MTHLLVNVDVDDLAAAEQFYCAAFELRPARRFGADAVELVGANAALYLLRKAAGTPAADTSGARRDYARHWTPVHLDFVVDDLDAAIARSLAAGGVQEHAVQSAAWGRIAVMADPFGHGYCLIEFSAAGYDAIASTLDRPSPELPMPALKRLQFTTTIHAPVPVVWRRMLEPESYRQWTSAFAEGSTYAGSWDQGAQIRFLGPSGDGMVSEIAENREHEFLSIRHLGFLADGVEDTTSDAVRAWAPAYENYTFIAVPEGTKLVIDQDIPAEWEEHMAGAWPKALALLKASSEAGGGAP